MKSLIRGTLLGVSLCTLSALAAAQPPSDAPRTLTVRYGDVDLTRIDGAIALYQRLRHAAREVCAPAVTSDRIAAGLARSCEEHAIAQAVADVNAPLLTSYFLGKSAVASPALARR